MARVDAAPSGRTSCIGRESFADDFDPLKADASRCPLKLKVGGQVSPANQQDECSTPVLMATNC